MTRTNNKTHKHARSKCCLCQFHTRTTNHRKHSIKNREMDFLLNPQIFTHISNHESYF